MPSAIRLNTAKPTAQHYRIVERGIFEREILPAIEKKTMIVRIAEIEVYPEYLKDYLETARTVGAESVRKEPGVVCIFPNQDGRCSAHLVPRWLLRCRHWGEDAAPPRTVPSPASQPRHMTASRRGCPDCRAMLHCYFSY